MNPHLAQVTHSNLCLQNNKWGSDYVEVIGKLTKEFALEEYKTNNLGNDLGKLMHYENGACCLFNPS